MPRFIALLSMGLLAISTSQLSAQFSVTPAGTVDSNAIQGDLANDVFMGTYAGPSTIFGSLSFSGNLTKVATDTLASEARFRISNDTASNLFDLEPSSTGVYAGTIAVANSTDGLFWIDNGDQYSFEAFEGFDDAAGPDQTWDSLSFIFDSVPVITDLGLFSPGTLTFDTLDSSFDTELALFSADGTFLNFDDDDDGGIGGVNPGESILMETLSAGDYLIVVDGFGGQFDNKLALGGFDGGNFKLNIDGTLVGIGSITPGQLATFSFTIAPVPEPSSLVVLAIAFGIGGIAVRRRRKQVA